MQKIGVLGAGHLGKIHIKCLKQLEGFYELVGFYDPNESMATTASEELGVKSFSSMEALFEAVDVVDIVTPTVSHFACAQQALNQGKHVFVEKPLTNTIAEAKELVALVDKTGLKFQVGHVERFNPAFVAAETYFTTPKFIEAHRLAEFNPRGTDVSVVLDLMIHDLDAILSVVRSPIKSISASGVAVVSETPDICNARIAFENGCVANLTASRISLKNMRKSRFFQRDAYISVDFLEKKTEIIRMKDVVGEPDPFSVTLDLGEGKGHKEIFFDRPEIEANNAIKDELASFYHSITNNTPEKVSVADGFRALEAAHHILEDLQRSLNQSV